MRASSFVVVLSLVLSRGQPAAAQGDDDDDRKGRALVGVARYAEAAEHYEHFAARRPQAKEAPAALADATVLRLGLGEEAAAIADAQAYVRRYGAVRTQQSAAIVLAVAIHHVEREEWETARAELTASLPLLDRGAIDVSIQAHAMLGRVLAHGAAHVPKSEARAEYQKVRELYRDPAEVHAGIEKSWPEESLGQRDRRLAKVLNAVGEALFALAEERRVKEVDALTLAAASGPATPAAVDEYLLMKVRPWLERKKTAIGQLEPAYVAILDLRPVPPPRWVIAASAAMAAMWGSVEDDLQRRRIPEPSLTALRSPIHGSYALPAMRRCLDLSVKYEFSDARSAACTTWLVTHDAATYHPVDELLPGLRSAAVRPADSPFTFAGESLRE